METSIIEQFNQTKYHLLLWLTIGWTLWFGHFILNHLLAAKMIINIISWLGLLGWIIFSINLVKYFQLRKDIKADRKLNEALNDELHSLFRYKSYLCGFWVLMALNVIFFGISSFYNISALIVTETTLYLGVLSVLLAGLIYNRE
ncbi:MAG: hypothetical protein Q8907_06785 [Bacteroidota bacterium]|nr:hypothetical protein [Bacteroidota bacterium]MDP4228224.1 hypothetical protein [Bacteroidota bacterium]MDP4273967.1 hypothetical protein [Bacteroidota bacterium]